MEVLLITKNFDNKGGAGRHSVEIKKALLDSGVGVCTPAFFEKKNFFNFIINIFRARKKAKNVDIIHAMDVWPYGVYGWFAVLGTRKKLFINGIGTYSVLPDCGFFKKFLMWRAFLRANQIFCISDYTKKRILEKIKLTNICTVFYGTTRLLTLAEEEIKNYKEIYKIKDEFPILLTVGAIKERKGQLDTLKAANLIKKKYPNFKYIIMGDDSDRYYVQKIREYAEKNNLTQNYEIISGIYDDKILSFFYQICDIFLLNSNNDGSHFEGFGGVLLEAAQFGKPVIGSCNCGIENAIGDGYNGYLTEQKNIPMISETILRVLDEKEKLGENSKKFSKNFSWSETLSKYMEFYKL